MPAVCRFYLKGYCRYGRNCRFEHPGEQSGYQNTNTKINDSSVATNFSFTSALREVAPNYPLLARSPPPSATNFSFTQALQSIGHNVSIANNDVDMSEGFVPSNRRDNLGGFFQAYSVSHQQQFQAPSLFQQPNTFQQQQQKQQQTLNTHFNFGSAQNPLVNNPSINNLTRQQSQLQTFQQQIVRKLEFSALEELSETELKAYQSEKFEFRSIPIRPPPETLCR